MSSDLNIWEDPLALDLDMVPTTEHQLGLISVWEGGQRIGRTAGGPSCLVCETVGAYVRLREDCRKMTEFFHKRWSFEFIPIDATTRQLLLDSLQACGVAHLIELPPIGKPLLEAFQTVAIIGLDPSWPSEIRLGEGILTWKNCD